MKICFNVSAMESGGAERVVSTLSNELVNLGHTVSIVMVSATKKKSYYDLDERVDLIALCAGYNSVTSPLKRVKLLRNVLLEQEPDVVIGFLPHICVYTWLALKGTKIPYILSERNDPNQYSLVYQILIKLAFSAANGCVFQTHDALAWYRKKPKATDKIIYNAVGLKYIPKAGSNKEKKKSVLFVGRLDAQKNYKLLLNVFQQFHTKHPDYILDVYGDGPEKDQFLTLITKLELNDSVNYHGKSITWHKDEFNAGMYVSTSDYEGMSNSLEEAAALGIPCVATDCPIGGGHELASVFDNIILTKVNDSNDFLAGMDKALSLHSYFENINTVVSKNAIVKSWLALIDIARSNSQ